MQTFSFWPLATKYVAYAWNYLIVFFKQRCRYFLENFSYKLFDLCLELKIFNIAFKQFDNQPFSIFQ